jgi:nucleolar complex protein 3
MILMLEHTTALNIIYIIQKILHNYKKTSILLHTDSNIGEGIYLPEVNDPEYCNANCTSLWEIVALQVSYRSIS